jgi:hypothetical protein
MYPRHRTKRICGLAIAALVASGQTVAQISPKARTACARTGDGSEHGAIVAEVSAFYRDLRAQQWAAVLDHFWPAKITARWEPPLGDAAWEDSPQAASTSKEDASACACHVDDATGAPASTEIHVVAAWARVVVSPCRTLSIDSRATEEEKGQELWLLSVSGRWKIVHLAVPERRFSPVDPALLRSSSR